MGNVYDYFKPSVRPKPITGFKPIVNDVITGKTPGVSRGGSSGGGSSSGSSSTPTTYAVTPLEALKKSAITGEDIVIPNFPNTPKGIIDRGNFVAQLARIQSGFEPVSAINVAARAASKRVDEANVAVESYVAQGEVLQTKLSALEAESKTINTSNASQVIAFNKKVNAFTIEAKAYETRGQQVESIVNSANVVSSNVERASNLQPGSQGGQIASVFQRNFDSDSGVAVKQTQIDTKSPILAQIPQAKQPGRDAPRITPYRDFPKGEKIAVETSTTLLQKGAFGSLLEKEYESTDIVDIVTGVKKIGLGIGSIPARFGELVGSEIAKVGGLKTRFDEDKQFIYESQSGKKFVTEIYSPKKSILKTKEAFKVDPVGTSIDIGLKTMVLVPGLSSIAGAKLISKSKMLQAGVKGLDVVAGKTESLIARSLYSGKKLVTGEIPSIKLAIQSSKGVTLGTLRTDVVSRLIGRKTINLSDITTKDIAKAFGEQGKAQYLKFPRSEQELFKRASVGPQAKFIKKTFAKYKIAPDDIIGFSAESGKATGLIEAITKKGVVKFKFVGAEPYGKFFASRTATGPFANLSSYDDIKVTFSPTRIPKPSVTVGVGQKGVLSTKGGIEATIKRLGFDISKTSSNIKSAFSKKLLASPTSRPLKLKVLRSKFGEAEVAKGYSSGLKELKGKFVSSPSRLFGRTGEEEFVTPFLSKTKLLGNLKERVFGSAIVRVGGKRVKLNIKGLLPKTEASVLNVSKTSKDLLGSVGKVGSKVSSGMNIKYINITPIVGEVGGLASSFRVPKVSKVSFSGITKSVSKTSLSSSVPKLSVSVPKVSLSISAKVTNIPKVSTSVSQVAVSVPSLSRSVPRIGTSIPKVSVNVSKVSTSVSQVAVSVPSLSRSVPKVSTSVSQVAVSVPIIPIISGFRFGPISFPKKKRGLLTAFDVEIKKKGKYRKVRVGLPKNLALAVGAKITGKETSRTFRITPRGLTSKKDIGGINLSKYRSPAPKSKLGKGLVFVEKSKFAIDSRTEKIGIPGKAARLRRSGVFSNNFRLKA